MLSSELRTVQVTTPRQKFATIDGCFIATAAYGSDLAPDVQLLRGVRDRYLAPSALGRALVRMYYASSPPLAKIIAKSEPLRASARAFLRPIVAAARAAKALDR
jgi:hypothetical protein